jgi:hypothetical protein
MNSNRKFIEDKVIKHEVNLWLESLKLPEDIGESLRILLRHDYYFAKHLSSIEDLEYQHGGLSIEKWKEAEYLLRDIEVAESLLLRLDPVQRRNPLAAMQGYHAKSELARALGKSESHTGNLLNPNSKANPSRESISELAYLFDVMDENIIEDDHEFDHHFNNYLSRSKKIQLSALSEILNSKEDFPSLIIHNDLSKKGHRGAMNFLANRFYGRVRKWTDFDTIEIYNLDENSLEVDNFASLMGFTPWAIVIRPAILRGSNRVIYYRKTKEQAPSLLIHLTEMVNHRHTIIKTL